MLSNDALNNTSMPFGPTVIVCCRLHCHPIVVPPTLNRRDRAAGQCVDVPPQLVEEPVGPAVTGSEPWQALLF
jgi:hypothetical protein